MAKRHLAYGLGWAIMVWPLAALGAGSLPEAPPPVRSSDAQQSAAQLLRTVALAAQAQNCQGGLAALKSLLTSPGFNALDHDEKAAAYDLGASCALQTDQNELAYKYATEGTRLKNPSPVALRVRFWLEAHRHKSAEALAMAEKLAATTKDDFNDIPISWFYNLDRDLGNAHDKALQRRLYALLIDRGYAPSEPGVSADAFRTKYAIVLAQSGDLKKAAAVFGPVTDSSELIRASLDRRLRAIVPADFDARAAVERDLNQLQARFGDRADTLRVVLKMAHLLRELGRGDDALALLERNRPDGPQAAKYTDLKSQAGFWWDSLSETRAFLGQYDEAETAMRKGADVKDNGAVNVNETLDLAELQMTHGHDADALTTLASFTPTPDTVSPFGMMVFTYNRGCARFRTGDLPGAKADRAYAVAHERDLPANLQSLLLCMGDLDAAASELIHRLSTPDLSTDALLDLSDYDPAPHPNPADPVEANLAKIKTRPDLMAAIARAGGTRRFRLQGGAV